MHIHIHIKKKEGLIRAHTQAWRSRKKEYLVKAKSKIAEPSALTEYVVHTSSSYVGNPRSDGKKKRI